jgi:hypothetical protein
MSDPLRQEINRLAREIDVHPDAIIGGLINLLGRGLIRADFTADDLRQLRARATEATAHAAQAS